MQKLTIFFIENISNIINKQLNNKQLRYEAALYSIKTVKIINCIYVIEKKNSIF